MNNKWTFKTIQVNAAGVHELVDLFPGQKARIRRYIKTLLAAKHSVVAKPFFSNYFVKASIGAANGAPVPAGNIEYGLCQALHGEESAVAAFRSRYGKGGKDIVLGFTGGTPGNIPAPCGNCRDIMLDTLGSDFEIVSGADDGGVAIVAKMSQYLFEDYRSGHEDEVFAISIEHAVKECESLANDAYSPKNVYPERNYCAVVVTDSTRYFGAHDIMCDYHPIYALRDAIRQARRANDSFLRYVVVICRNANGRPPYVMYKDRQHLAEFNLQGELLRGEEKDPPVFLAAYNSQNRMSRIWCTSVKQWLPFAFTPHAFGPEFIKHLAAYYHNLRQR